MNRKMETKIFIIPRIQHYKRAKEKQYAREKNYTNYTS